MAVETIYCMAKLLDISELLCASPAYDNAEPASLHVPPPPPFLHSLPSSEDISIEAMHRFELTCLNLDVTQCEATRPEDKARILRTVSG